MNRRIMAPLVLAICGMMWVSNARATSLTYVGEVTVKGTGIGSGPTIMAIQDNGTEWGSVLWDGRQNVDNASWDGTKGAYVVDNSGAYVIDTTGSTGKGDKQAQTFALGDLKSNGIDASNLGVLFQVNQVGGSTLGLNSFSLQLWSPGDGTAGSSTLLDTVTFTQSERNTAALAGVGTGHANYLFTPDTPLSSAWIVTPEGINASNRIGMLVPTDSISGSNDGIDTFLLVNATDYQLAPEPASATLLGVSALGLTVYAWWRRRQLTGARRLRRLPV
jgi:hypothetical protein